MEELYRIIEQKIKDAGYPRAISGEMVYGDICDQIEGKENGSYVLLSKVEDDVVYYNGADQKKKSFACRMFFFLPLFDFTLMDVYMNTRIK